MKIPFRHQAKFEEGLEPEISKYYKDEDTMSIVNAFASVVGKIILETLYIHIHFIVIFRNPGGGSVGSLWRFLDPIHNGNWMGSAATSHGS